jgi:hypothetical protein
MDMKRNDKQEVQRKRYSKPVMKRFGNVREVTRKAGSVVDNSTNFVTRPPDV